MRTHTGTGLAVLIFLLCFAGLIGCALTSRSGRPLSDAAARGRSIYQRHCVGCHSTQATGDAFQSIPALAGQRVEYLRRQIERFSTDERHDARMRWAFSRMSANAPESAVDLATYLSQLPVLQFADIDVRNRERGEASYAAHCATCHGPEALGSVEGIPMLRAQQNTYLVHRLRGFASSATVTDAAVHSLGDSDIIAISSYLSALRGPTSAPAAAAEK